MRGGKGVCDHRLVSTVAWSATKAAKARAVADKTLQTFVIRATPKVPPLGRNRSPADPSTHRIQ